MSTGTPSSTNATGGPCGACKYLRRKCVAECIFAPYFLAEQGATHFAAVHKVFGASNVSKLLLHIPVNKRLDAVITMCYEAQARIRDPVHGCVAQIFALRQQVMKLEAELSYFRAQLASLGMAQPPPPHPPPNVGAPLGGLAIADLLTTTSIDTAYDLSSLFDPTLHCSPWIMHPPTQEDNDDNRPEFDGFVATPFSSGTSLSPHG